MWVELFLPFASAVAYPCVVMAGGTAWIACAVSGLKLLVVYLVVQPCEQVLKLFLFPVLGKNR